MKKISFIILIALFATSTFSLEAKKKKNVNEQAQNIAKNGYINYRFWDRQVINHRGFIGFPENSFIGLEEAIMKGYQIIECDVAVTKDNVLVLCQDPKVDRASTSKGYIKDLSIQYLIEMDFGSKKDPKFSGTKITTLKEAILLCRRNNVMISINCADKERFPNSNYEMLYTFIKKNGMLGSTIFCDESENLKTLLDIDPNVIVSIEHCLGEKDVEKGLEIAQRVKAAEFSVRNTLATQNIINFIHDNGFYVKVWNVENSGDMKRFVNMGVDHIVSDQFGPKFNYRIHETKPED